MALELERLVTRAKEQAASQNLVYFSGHGKEWERGTFLIPVDPKTDIGGGVESNALNLSALVDKLQRARGIKLFMLDACGSRPGKGGTATLPEPTVKGNEVLVAFAMQSSMPASDKGQQGRGVK